MKFHHLLALGAMFTFGACGAEGQEGDECETEADCGDGLECHLHEHDGEVSDHGECEAHEEGEEHDDEEEEAAAE